MGIKEQKEELKCFLSLKQLKRNFTKNYFHQNYSELYSDFLTWNFPNDFTFAQKIFHYLNDDKELKLGLCLKCGKRCKFIDLFKGYHIYCCRKCAYLSSERIKKSKETNLRRYGDENYNNKTKQKQTCIERYGGQGNASVELQQKQKETLKERYNDENYRNLNKMRKTKLERYNDENYNNEEKMKETNLERYGNEIFRKSKTCEKKIKQTNLERYGNENYNNM